MEIQIWERFPTVKPADAQKEYSVAWRTVADKPVERQVGNIQFMQDLHESGVPDIFWLKPVTPSDLQVYQKTDFNIITMLRHADSMNPIFEQPDAPLHVMMAKIASMLHDEMKVIGHPHNGSLMDYAQLQVLLLDSFQRRHRGLDLYALQIASINRATYYITLDRKDYNWGH